MYHLISTAGRQKFYHLHYRSSIRSFPAVGIGTSARTITSVRGLNMQGIAEIFTEDQAELNYALKLFKPMLDDFEQRTGAPVVFPLGMVRVIRTTPLQKVYFHYMKGIAHECWDAH